MQAQRISTECRFVQRITGTVLRGRRLSQADALAILSLRRQTDIMYLLAHANIIRNHFHGHAIHRCAIINARSGLCSEDCSFCAQSAQHPTAVKTYGLKRHDMLVRASRTAAAKHIARFSIVTSGRGVQSGSRVFDRLCRVIEAIAQEGLVEPCASLGIVSRAELQALQAAGLKRYHHNLETAGSFYSRICTTHTFAARVATIEEARSCGIEVCAGGILGLGESLSQRVELAFALRDLQVESVPLNFLQPIPGTLLAGRAPEAPMELLKAVAMFRYVLPRQEIRICGGRGYGLQSLQPLMYCAGANGVMVGNYLTTEGRTAEVDDAGIRDLGLEPV
jgi:biotin synthase